MWLKAYQADLARGAESHVGHLSWHWMSHHYGSAASGLLAPGARTYTACHIVIQVFDSCSPKFLPDIDTYCSRQVGTHTCDFVH